MGLKRRGTGRRQVLNIDDVQDAPRKTWQSKYLQICVDHNKKRQMEVDRTSHVVSGTASNPLSGLVGQYRSDSDSEDETVAQKQELNDQVSVFLKEIQTIAPASSAAPPPAAEPAPASVLTPSLPLVPSSASMPVPAYAASDLAALPPEGAHSVTGSEFRAGCYPWQVCYDVDTGYPYYWNMETNEVTWEAPEDVRTYLNHYWMQQMAAGTYPMHHNYLPEQNIYNQDECSEVIAGNNIIETITPKDYFPKKCKPHYEETEYEKIEMITSYGPESDESEDETTVKKPKIEDIDSSEYTSHMIGPLPADGINCNFRSTNKKVKQLSPSDHRYSDSLVSCISALQQEEDQSEGPVFEGSSLLSNDVPDMGPPGEEGSDISYPPEPSYSNECDIISEKKTASEVEKDSISVDTDYAEQKETAKDSSCTNTIEGDDMDQDETIILTRICNQARILKELGGEIPDEVQHLIEPFQKENQEIDVNCSDNIIDTNTAADVEASSSAKTNSFALIAGYGNDSDGEEDKKGGNGRQHLNNHTNSDPIFPIINYKNHITTEKNTNVEERALNILISSEPTVEPKQMKRKKRLDISSVGAIVKGQGDNISAGSTSCLNIHVSTANAGSYSVVSSSKSTSVSDSAASEHTRAEKNEVEVSSDTNCGSKSTSNSTSVADKSATTPFISSYDSDASYGERRGFGFPSSSVNGSETAPDTFETRFVKDSEDKTNVNSKMINFIKAETLNPTTDSEVKTSSPGDDEKLKINDECDKIQEHLNEMSELINEKVTFLSEGKEPVSSLQLLTTQYKTLAEAWEVGALCESYWNQWLEGTLDELARLEEAAAPAGWSCEWCSVEGIQCIGMRVQTTVVDKDLLGSAQSQRDCYFSFLHSECQHSASNSNALNAFYSEEELSLFTV